MAPAWRGLFLGSSVPHVCGLWQLVTAASYIEADVSAWQLVTAASYIEGDVSPVSAKSSFKAAAAA